MPGRNKNRELINEIKTGKEQVLLYLFRKHYTEIKKIFTSFNIGEGEIPAQAASVLVKIWMEIHQNNFSENIDLTSYLYNTARESAEKLAVGKKEAMKIKDKDRAAEAEPPQEIIAGCVNILDNASRQALQWRYAENYSIEQIAEKLKMDVTASHDFINRAFAQLSSIVKIRMEQAI